MKGIRWGANVRGFIIVGAAMLFAANEYMDAHRADFIKFIGQESLLWIGLFLAVGLAGLIGWRGFLDTSTGKAKDADTIEQTPAGPAVRTSEAAPQTDSRGQGSHASVTETTQEIPATPPPSPSEEASARATG